MGSRNNNLIVRKKRMARRKAERGKKEMRKLANKMRVRYAAY